eukprot:4804627-Amphidinium_carterae.2
MQQQEARLHAGTLQHKKDAAVSIIAVASGRHVQAMDLSRNQAPSSEQRQIQTTTRAHAKGDAHGRAAKKYCELELHGCAVSPPGCLSRRMSRQCSA